MFRHMKWAATGAATATIAFIAVVGATAAFGSGTGSTSLPAHGQPAAEPVRPNAKPAFQVAGTISEMGYVPVVSCILVDTRLAGGRFAAGATRSYDVWG